MLQFASRRAPDDTARVAYRIEYSREALDHLSTLTARQCRTVSDTVDRQLMDHPSVETRNRKRMRPNPLAPWELRIGDLRVYYDVEDEIVIVLAVGIKVRDRVRIGQEVVDL